MCTSLACQLEGFDQEFVDEPNNQATGRFPQVAGPFPLLGDDLDPFFQAAGGELVDRVAADAQVLFDRCNVSRRRGTGRAEAGQRGSSWSRASRSNGSLMAGF